MKYMSRGFTIVELLVVVIVIGIIASISIVSYNGVQDRAEFSHAQTDMKHINDALIIYRAKNGQYPSTGGSAAWTFQYTPSFNSTINNSFLSALVTGGYLDSMPVGKSRPDHCYYTYGYTSNGTDYKLLRTALKSCTPPYNGLPGVELSNNSMIDTTGNRSTWAWGYWSSGATTW